MSDHDSYADLIVIGAGAAGLMAAAEAAKRLVARGKRVLLLEKNRKAGVKILMSGGTRCNLTQDTDARGILDVFSNGGRFLRTCVGRFPPHAVVQHFEGLGVATKRESTGKIFPKSNRAVEVRDALLGDAIDAGVRLLLDTGVQRLRPPGDANTWKVETDAACFEAAAVMVTAGGRSWPGCGTTGDAYDWLQSLGHTIVRTRPALVPLVGGTPWMNALSGLTLDDCITQVVPREGRVTGESKKPSRKQTYLSTRRSSLLFTHFGFSGPAAMDVSGAITAAASPQDVEVRVDLLPNWKADDLVADLSKPGGGQISSRLSHYLPTRLSQALVEASGGNTSVDQWPKKHRVTLLENIKSLRLPVSGTRGFAKAEVTAGGVDLSEVDPKSMRSRRHEGLFIAGEVLDVDGPIGGYNFQAAFASGRLAAQAAADWLLGL